MHKKVGVIVAAYNGQNYIKKQLESIVNQTVKPDLIVISDAGSKDRTVSICKSFLSDSGIAFKILTSEEQLSVQLNFNKALQNCECDYIFFSDQDDFWKKNKIEITLNNMRKVNACMGFSNAFITDSRLIPNGKSLWDTIGFNPDDNITVYDKQDINLINELIKHNIVTGMTMCITSELREFVLPLFKNAIHDKWIAMLAAHFGTVVAINEKLVLYRQHGNNVVGTKRSIKKSLENKKRYIHNIEERLEMIKAIKGKIRQPDYMSKFDFDKYIAYLILRTDFVKRNIGFTSLIKIIKYYQTYEYNAVEIIVKDLIVRFV